MRAPFLMQCGGLFCKDQGALLLYGIRIQLVDDCPGAVALPARVTVTGPDGLADTVAPEIEFGDVSLRYPTASEVSLASLESIAWPAPERRDATAGRSSASPSPGCC